jgi:hypothetical protein
VVNPFETVSIIVKLTSHPPLAVFLETQLRSNLSETVAANVQAVTTYDRSI